MTKNLVIIQNITLNEHLALSTYLRNITLFLSKLKGIKLHLLVSEGQKNRQHLPANVSLREIDTDLYSIWGNIKFIFLAFMNLKDINRICRIDIIHCLYPDSSVASAVLFKLLINHRAKIIYDLRSPWIENSIQRGSISPVFVPLYRRIAYLVEFILSIFVDKFIFITEGLRDYYEKRVRLKSKPHFIIPSGVDVYHFSKQNSNSIRSRYEIDKDDILIGYVGGLSKMRRLGFLLEALRELLEQDKKYKLMFVGSGNDKDVLETASRQMGIQNHVIFTSEVSYKDVPDYISAFDIGVCHLPDIVSFLSSFPMKILEYLACEIPVVASDINAHKVIQRHTSNLHLYKTESVTLFVEQIQQVLLTGYIPERIKETFGWEAICGKINIVYSSCFENER